MHLETESCPDCSAAIVRALTDAGNVMPLEPGTSVDGSYALLREYRGSHELRWLRAIFVYADERRGPLHRIHHCATREQHEAMRLFTPVPGQIPGQMAM